MLFRPKIAQEIAWEQYEQKLEQALWLASMGIEIPAPAIEKTNGPGSEWIYDEQAAHLEPWVEHYTAGHISSWVEDDPEAWFAARQRSSAYTLRPDGPLLPIAAGLYQGNRGPGQSEEDLQDGSEGGTASTLDDGGRRHGDEYTPYQAILAGAATQDQEDAGTAAFAGVSGDGPNTALIGDGIAILVMAAAGEEAIHQRVCVCMALLCQLGSGFVASCMLMWPEVSRGIPQLAELELHSMESNPLLGLQWNCPAVFY